MDENLGDLLVAGKLITPQELESARQEERKTKKPLGRVLLDMGLVEEKKLLSLIAREQGVPFVEIEEMHIEEGVVSAVPAKFVWHYRIMPIKLDRGVLTVAVSDPFDMWPLDDLETNLGYRVAKVFASSADILESIRKHYGVGAETIERILASKPAQRSSETLAEEHVEDLERIAGDASVIKLVNQLLQQAIADRATDIHIESFRNDVFLRYRIDGILYDMQVNDEIKYLYSAIISRIKIMSCLDIIERRIPQDGRAKARIGDSEYDLRISIIPTLYGENIVIRILPTTMLFSIADLGMAKDDLDTLEHLLKRPHGIIFVTGPTGSGKSTTLYAFLSKINTRQRKIVTIEDPVEYELRGISQSQVNPKIGLTFARMLRSVLRHDPNVIMVGEVRDPETAEVTIQTALTGHLVFSTLHTNDAAGGVTRLIDMGVDPFLIASSVEALIAQRLVRRICPGCKEPFSPPAAELRQFEKLNIRKQTKFFKGKGCKACNDTGYSGRIGIFEILVVNEQIRSLILAKTSSDMIKKKALESGMRTLLMDGWNKALSGLTTIEEVLRVTQTEE